MADGDREYIGGWLVTEARGFQWRDGISDHDMKVTVCGEIGHVRWLLFIAAWREACRRDLELALQGMAERVGIEYSPLRTASRGAAQPIDTGGKP